MNTVAHLALSDHGSPRGPGEARQRLPPGVHIGQVLGVVRVTAGPIRGEYCHHETSFPPITAQLSPGHDVGVQRLGRELAVLHAAPQPRQHRRRVPHRHLALPLAAQQPE